MAQKKRENPLTSLVFNIILPSIIMSKADDWFGVDPKLALAVALVFPLTYGIIDFIKSKRCNVFSVIGFVSVFLTGVIGLLNLPKEYIAIKEAFVPALIGFIVFVSAFTRYPLIKTLIFNDTLVEIDKIDERIHSGGHEIAFKKLLASSTLKLSSSFLLSAVLNFALACYFVHSETGTAEFNKELARMTIWSYPVIVLPCTIVLMVTLMSMMKKLTQLTGLSFEEMFVGMKDDQPVNSGVTQGS